MPGSSAPAADDITPYDQKGAVIFAYHRIGEDGFPETNLRREQFEAHIREIVSGGYNVLPIPEIIKTLKEKKNLPPRTIGITFEGGYKSILENAIPLLQKHDLPFTLFISTDKADWDLREYINWNEIKKLARSENVTIGIHPASYVRLTGSEKHEIRSQINKAKTRYRENLSEDPSLFAYPFGEYSLAYREIAVQSGIEAAFGQQSGVAWPGSDMMALPRFTMTDSFADLDRFRLTANALPLPVSDIEPEDPYIKDNSPITGFTIHPSLSSELDSLSCFSSAYGRPQIEAIGNRIELRHEGNLDQTRIRINCTMPGPSQPEPDGTPRWRWFGMLLNKPETFYD